MKVVVVCIWRLLTLVRCDRIFSAVSLRWVDVIARTFLAAWVLLVVMSDSIVFYIYFAPELRDPGVPALVLRDLLRQATTLHEDLEGLI